MSDSHWLLLDPQADLLPDPVHAIRERVTEDYASVPQPDHGIMLEDLKALLERLDLLEAFAKHLMQQRSEGAPTTDARERAREIVGSSTETRYITPENYVDVLCRESDLIDRIAAALSSTPGVGDAIAEQMTDDELRAAYEYHRKKAAEYADEGSKIWRMRVRSGIATDADKERLEALQPSTPSEPHAATAQEIADYLGFTSTTPSETTHDDVVQAITDIQEARESHVQWAAHLRNTNRHDCQGCTDHVAHIGEASYHDEWIEKYNRVIRLLAVVPYSAPSTQVEFHACDYTYSDDGKCIICGLPDNVSELKEID